MNSFIVFFESGVGFHILYMSLYVLSIIFSIVASKCNNGKMKKVLMVLPEAMEWAEFQGDTPEKKLELCVEYITNRVKHVSDSFIIKLIEPYIKMTKNVNSTVLENKSTSIMSRTTR